MHPIRTGAVLPLAQRAPAPGTKRPGLSPPLPPVIDRFTGATLEFLEANAALGAAAGGVGAALGAAPGATDGRSATLAELFRSYDPVCEIGRWAIR